MTDNLEIWNAVSKTDPAHTKTVNQRGGFTAINANYQIMNVTAQFGPIGIGWGYTNGTPIFENGFVIVPVTMWYGTRDNVFGPVFGCAEMFGKRPDSDAPKKAGTDGLTKLISQLGFNADVFLGRYDDQKYMAEITEEFKAKEDPEKAKADAQRKVDAYRKPMLDAVKSQNALPALLQLKAHAKWKADLEALRGLDPQAAGEVEVALTQAEQNFEQQKEEA